MTKEKLPDHLRKVPLPIRVDPDVFEAAKASGNASSWMNDAGREKLASELPGAKIKTSKTNKHRRLRMATDRKQMIDYCVYAGKPRLLDESRATMIFFFPAQGVPDRFRGVEVRFYPRDPVAKTRIEDLGGNDLGEGGHVASVDELKILLRRYGCLNS